MASSVPLAPPPRGSRAEDRAMTRLGASLLATALVLGPTAVRADEPPPLPPAQYYPPQPGQPPPQYYPAQPPPQYYPPQPQQQYAPPAWYPTTPYSAPP